MGDGMSKHTSTPWELFDRNGIVAVRNPRTRSKKSEIVFWTGFDSSHFPKQAKANAAFIVKAVNSHDALVKALQQISDTDRYPDHEDTAAELREIARGALSQREDK